MSLFQRFSTNFEIFSVKKSLKSKKAVVTRSIFEAICKQERSNFSVAKWVSVVCNLVGCVGLACQHNYTINTDTTSPIVAVTSDNV